MHPCVDSVEKVVFLLFSLSLYIFILFFVSFTDGRSNKNMQNTSNNRLPFFPVFLAPCPSDECTALWRSCSNTSPHNEICLVLKAIPEPGSERIPSQCACLFRDLFCAYMSNFLKSYYSRKIIFCESFLSWFPTRPRRSHKSTATWLVFSTRSLKGCESKPVCCCFTTQEETTQKPNKFFNRGKDGRVFVFVFVVVFNLELSSWSFFLSFVCFIPSISVTCTLFCNCHVLPCTLINHRAGGWKKARKAHESLLKLFFGRFSSSEMSSSLFAGRFLSSEISSSEILEHKGAMTVVRLIFFGRGFGRKFLEEGGGCRSMLVLAESHTSALIPDFSAWNENILWRNACQGRVGFLIGRFMHERGRVGGDLFFFFLSSIFDRVFLNVWEKVQKPLRVFRCCNSPYVASCSVLVGMEMQCVLDGSWTSKTCTKQVRSFYYNWYSTRNTFFFEISSVSKIQFASLLVLGQKSILKTGMSLGSIRGGGG